VIVDTLAHQLVIAGFSWLIISGATAATDVLESNLLGHDEYKNRGARTQLILAQRVFSTLVLVAGAALILSSFSAVPNLGVSLLASAGIASVVLGLAAQKTLGGILAGFQLSITQPVRLGDSVFVEGELGTVEEIRLTYAVVRLWDLRRLVLPVSKFLDQPFQNWTRVPSPLLGSVELWADFRTPLAPLREQLASICKQSKLWDGGTCSLVVLDTSQQAMKLRALVSAADATQLFDLRCEVREQLIAFLGKLDGGVHLPFSRSEELRSGRA